MWLWHFCCSRQIQFAEYSRPLKTSEIQSTIPMLLHRCHHEDLSLLISRKGCHVHPQNNSMAEKVIRNHTKDEKIPRWEFWSIYLLRGFRITHLAPKTNKNASHQNVHFEIRQMFSKYHNCAVVNLVCVQVYGQFL